MKCPKCDNYLKNGKCEFCGYVHNVESVQKMYSDVSERILGKLRTNFYVTLFGGWLGIHKFMQGKIGIGLLYMFTYGLFFIGWIIDIINAYKIYKNGKETHNNIYKYNEKNENTQNIDLKNDIKYNNDYDNMDGHDFEYFCANILRENHFESVEVTQASADHGIDILAEKDGITYAIQCKCYTNDIGNAAVQQAHTGKSIYKKDIAVVLTNRYFTRQAREESETLGVKLWDRDALNKLIDSCNK